MDITRKPLPYSVHLTRWDFNNQLRPAQKKQPMKILWIRMSAVQTSALNCLDIFFWAAVTKSLCKNFPLPLKRHEPSTQLQSSLCKTTRKTCLGLHSMWNRELSGEGSIVTSKIASLCVMWAWTVKVSCSYLRWVCQLACLSCTGILLFWVPIKGRRNGGFIRGNEQWRTHITKHLTLADCHVVFLMEEHRYGEKIV